MASGAKGIPETQKYPDVYCWIPLFSINSGVVITPVYKIDPRKPLTVKNRIRSLLFVITENNFSLLRSPQQCLPLLYLPFSKYKPPLWQVQGVVYLRYSPAQ